MVSNLQNLFSHPITATSSSRKNKSKRGSRDSTDEINGGIKKRNSQTNGFEERLQKRRNSLSHQRTLSGGSSASEGESDIDSFADFSSSDERDDWIDTTPKKETPLSLRRISIEALSNNEDEIPTSRSLPDEDMMTDVFKQSTTQQNRHSIGSSPFENYTFPSVSPFSSTTNHIKQDVFTKHQDIFSKQEDPFSSHDLSGMNFLNNRSQVNRSPQQQQEKLPSLSSLTLEDPNDDQKKGPKFLENLFTGKLGPFMIWRKSRPK